jgi:hypothetical protein
VDIVMRAVALWLSLASAALGAASLYYQSLVFWPYVPVGLVVDAGLLVLVAAGAAGLALRSSSRLTTGALTVLTVGHLAAATATRTFLASLPTCFMNESADYPTNTGSLCLFGPGVAVILACALWRVAEARLRR